MSLLEISHLNLDIGPIPILRDVNLSLEPGQVLGIIGESGSGKSMTALAIMQLLPRLSRCNGSIALDGQDLLRVPERELNLIRGGRVGMVFQEPMTALNPLKTIGDQVAEALALRGYARRDAAALASETLERVGLSKERFPRDRYPHQLSGGQRQRVVIAMAIANRPHLLIADEPTTALDVTTQAKIVALLRRLVDEDGMGLVFITHDLGLVAGLADHVAIMQKGEVVESGATLELFRNLTHPYSRMLYAAASHHPPKVPPPEGGRVPVLEAREVVRAYPLPRQRLLAPRRTFRAVKSVSLEIGRGENVGLVGESGCGKSTLARAILGLEPTQGGSIAIDGTVIDPRRGASYLTRRHLQAVFQDPYGSFNPRHRVERLVSEPFHLLGADAPTGTERQKRIGRALEDVGLGAADGEKYIHEFSGGQRQRIAIARALIIEPSLIVLDEAVSALDVSIRAQILDLLADLSVRRHVSYLFISHDLSVVRAITHRVMVMKSGQIVETGETEAVFSNPAHPYTRALIAATPNLEAALKEREGAGAGE